MSDRGFKDHFSGHADTYRAARPGYPPALFEWLATLPRETALAWDAGCGNGQASVALADHFTQVIGTDPSTAQIANAQAHAKVSYQIEPAETTTLADDTVDLISAAQALHWFDHPRFYTEAIRVARPGAVIAAWSYASCSITPAVDAVVMRLYENIVGPYWPPERRHIEDGYVSLPFPFERIEAPAFAMQSRWSLAHFCAYLRSWSATQRYISANGADPVSMIEDELTQRWQTASSRTVCWPLSVRVGRLRR